MLVLGVESWTYGTLSMSELTTWLGVSCGPFNGVLLTPYTFRSSWILTVG
jgi:hypothetical protein